MNQQEIIRRVLKEESGSIKDKLFYFKRHLSELRNHLWDIIMEGFDMFNPCDYDDYESYLGYLIRSCAITLINSYDELYKGDTDEIEEIITQYIKDNYIKYFKGAWRDKECDEDEDTINENKGEIKEDLSPIITNLLERIIVVNNEDVCKVEVTAPWNRGTISGGNYRGYAVKVYFIGGPNTKNWPRTMAVVMKEENIMNEVWQTVFNFMGLYIDLYADRVKKCNKTMNENFTPWVKRRLDMVMKAEREAHHYMNYKYKSNNINNEPLDKDTFTNMYYSVMMDELHPHLSNWGTEEFDYSNVRQEIQNSFQDNVEELWKYLNR
jgi:hypothetical protein